MNVFESHISDCVQLEPAQFRDDRGIFAETFKSSYLPHFKPVQTNYSHSKKGVLRGVHRTPYAKLVTCVVGNAYDVCVDLRPESSTYQEHYGVFLHGVTLNSLYIPPYCGHVFVAITDCVLVYQQDGEYNKSMDETYCYDQYNINWPVVPTIISDKDLNSCD